MSLLLAGCSFFSRSKSNFYSFERIVPATPVANISGLPVGIDGLEVPPGFDRRDVVVRKADHGLDVRGTEQWSASLETMSLHTLAYDLAGRLPVGMVILPGQAKPLNMRSIDVVVEEFAAGPEPRVLLDVRWTLRTTSQPDVARHEQIAVDIPDLKSANVAAGMSQALAALADRMAGQLSVAK